MLRMLTYAAQVLDRVANEAVKDNFEKKMFASFDALFNRHKNRSSYYYMCPHTTTCPHTRCVSSYHHYVSSHTTMTCAQTSYRYYIYTQDLAHVGPP